MIQCFHLENKNDDNNYNDDENNDDDNDNMTMMMVVVVMRNLPYKFVVKTNQGNTYKVFIMVPDT